MLVEDLDSAYGLRLKDERGPAEVMDFLRVYGSSLAVLELTGRVDPEVSRVVEGLREEAQPRLRTGGTR